MTTAAYAPTTQANPEEVLQAIRTIVLARHPFLAQLHQLGYGQPQASFVQPQMGYGQPQAGYGMQQQSNPEEVLQAIRTIVLARHPFLAQLHQLGYGQPQLGVGQPQLGYGMQQQQSNPEEVLQAIRTIVAARHPALQQWGYGQQPQQQTFGFGQFAPQQGIPQLWQQYGTYGA